MKVFLITMIAFLPLRQVEVVQSCFNSGDSAIFMDYENQNFVQLVEQRADKIYTDVRSLNFFELNLNYRIAPDRKFIGKSPAVIQDIFSHLPVESMNLKEYMVFLTAFLKENIAYSEDGLPQEPIAVLMNGKANCVGYSNLLRFLLRCVGIASQPARGFYLKPKNGNVMVPIPHRWVEILLDDGSRYFYDPQHQTFSAHYILVKRDTDFSRIRKFEVTLLSRSKEIINQ